MYNKLFYIFRYISPELGFVKHLSRCIIIYVYPHLFTGFYNHTLRLHRRVAVLLCVNNDILYKRWHVYIVPTLSQRFKFFTGPCCKGVGTIIRPGLKVWGSPVLGNTYKHRHHLFILCKGCHTKAAHAEHKYQ